MKSSRDTFLSEIVIQSDLLGLPVTVTGQTFFFFFFYLEWRQDLCIDAKIFP